MSEISNHLMNFQEFLLHTLYESDDAKLIQQKLKNYTADPVLAKWLSELEPEMLEVAARMLQHWGRKCD